MHIVRTQQFKIDTFAQVDKMHSVSMVRLFALSCLLFPLISVIFEPCSASLGKQCDAMHRANKYFAGIILVAMNNTKIAHGTVERERKK